MELVAVEYLKHGDSQWSLAQVSTQSSVWAALNGAEGAGNDYLRTVYRKVHEHTWRFSNSMNLYYCTTPGCGETWDDQS